MIHHAVLAAAIFEAVVGFRAVRRNHRARPSDRLDHRHNVDAGLGRRCGDDSVDHPLLAVFVGGGFDTTVERQCAADADTLSC
jgi:hypothetical protein